MLAEDRIRILHMIEYCESAVEFVTGRKKSDLDDDKMLRFAVIRAIEIIGEAATKVSIETRDALPHIPWADIIGMRNQLIHAYFRLTNDLLWDTATRNIPDLLLQLRVVISPKDGGEP